ncbi:SAM-dependent methyltransferase [Spirillospora sp. CA-108201]
MSGSCSATLNRDFTRRAVREVTKAGVEQYLVLGSGLPDGGSVQPFSHEVAPHARVVYNDIDPMVESHRRAFLPGDSENTGIVLADLGDTSAVLGAAETARLIDLSKPIGVISTAVFHLIPGDISETVSAYVDVMAPPGSYLIVSACVAEGVSPEMIEVCTKLFPSFEPRSREELSAWCAGLKVVAPGVEMVQRWRPEKAYEPPLDMRVLCVVARKPGGRATRRI